MLIIFGQWKVQYVWKYKGVDVEGGMKRRDSSNTKLDSSTKMYSVTLDIRLGSLEFVDSWL